MEVDCIPYRESGFFSKIVGDYLSKDEQLKPFYSRPNTIVAYGEQIKEKQFSTTSRKTLHEALGRQYAEAGIKLKADSPVLKNLDLILDDSSYTLTTGHQLCLFTGPLYFIYKILSTIKLSKTLKEAYPEHNFLPVFWLASEDHDFEEVSHFQVQQEKIVWDSKQTGAVGRMTLKGLEPVFEAFKASLPAFGLNRSQLLDLFEKAYLKQKNLADATRFLAHELFSAYGLLILDGDDQALKTSFAPLVQLELTEGISSQLVEKQNEALQVNYKIQVNPREINLFYLKGNKRNRIIKEGESFRIDEEELTFTQEEIKAELKNFPERFSPNVILRPVYQELILPNLAYIGGGGELAYWFQLKTCFEYFKIPMPILVLRNSAMYLNSKQTKAKEKLKLSAADLFVEEGVLVKSWVKKHADVDFSLVQEQEELDVFYAKLREKAKGQDHTLVDHVLALQKKQNKQLEAFREKLVRHQRRKEKQAVKMIESLKSDLFPAGSLQERKANFTALWLEMGEELIPFLLEAFEMPSQNFTLIYSDL